MTYSNQNKIKKLKKAKKWKNYNFSVKKVSRVKNDCSEINFFILTYTNSKEHKNELD